MMKKRNQFEHLRGRRLRERRCVPLSSCYVIRTLTRAFVSGQDSQNAR